MGRFVKRETMKESRNQSSLTRIIKIYIAILLNPQDALMEVYVDDPPDVPDLEETHQDVVLMLIQCKHGQRHKAADCRLVFVRDGFNDVHLPNTLCTQMDD